ncbi:MAG: sensor histidine kinase [Rikenellaceae bacterium]
MILCISLFGGSIFNSNSFDTFGVAMLSISIVKLIFIYLLNYLLFIPRYLFTGHRNGFFVCNVVLVVALLLLSYYVNAADLLQSLRPLEDIKPYRRPSSMYLTRDFINYVLMIGLVTALRLAERLEASEAALKEAESARIKAELANMRSQINPHFLLNTLNNIYALTAIDADKAQKTIKELSDLLRYILYDNLNDRVSLMGEVKFLKTYIELMSIRLPLKVKLHTEFKISEQSTTLIAPLIFISLIENAFKHSVSASGEGYIEIYFEERSERQEVVLSIKNSNHAKRDEDKSGHGIGLEQVRRRLELIYPDNYTWEVAQSDAEYSSVLTLKSSV